MAKNGFRVMDSDMHIMEPPDLWQRYIDQEFRSQAPAGRVTNWVKDLQVDFPSDTGPRGNGSGKFGRNHELDQVRFADHARRGWSPQVQLDAMDIEGVDTAVLYPSLGLSALTDRDLDSKLAAAISRAYNQWLFEFCQADRERMFGAGMFSVYDINDAVQETYRVVEDLGFVAVFVRSNVVNDKPWHDPYYEPLWSALETLNVPLGFHEATGSRSHQAGEQYSPSFSMRSAYSQPFTQMLGVGSFLLGGILERHPGLKVAFLEANCAWLPWLLWRLDETYERFGDVIAVETATELSMPPSEYFRRQCYASIEPDETPAIDMINKFGSDRLVFSTDYPHVDSRYPDAVEAFLGLPLSDDDKRKILWDNCADFYAGRMPVTNRA